MSAEEVRRRERAFYDERAAAATPREPDEYDRALLDALGPIEGLRVLELGCGSGDLTAELVRAGAEVVAVDVSAGMVERARGRAPEAEFVVAAVEETGLAPESFDRAVGKWILHHADVAGTARELARLLREGARGAFFENHDRNPLLRAARRALWRAGRAHAVGTSDERPLSDDDIGALVDVFGRVELSYPGFYFFESLSRALGHRAHPQLKGLDQAVWQRVPAARPYGYHVLIEFSRTAGRAPAPRP
ncbi:MAG TPA: class I SAM-dependent methyltransferase [Thermoleophilaceae bacterium]